MSETLMADLARRMGAEEPVPAPPFVPTDLLPDWPEKPFPGQDEWLRGWAALLSSERFRKKAGVLEDDVVSLGTAGAEAPGALYQRAVEKVRLLRPADEYPDFQGTRRVVWRFVVAALVWRLARREWPTVPTNLLEGDDKAIIQGMRAAADECLVTLGLAEANAVR